MEVQMETIKDVTKLLSRAFKKVISVASMLTGGGVLVLCRLPSPPFPLHYVRCPQQFPQQWLSKVKCFAQEHSRVKSALNKTKM